MASLVVGRHGRVLAFEPNGKTFARLRTLLESNPHRNIECFECAVSNECGELIFHHGPEDHTGISSLRDLGANEQRAVRVSSMTIYSLLPKLPTIRLIKIHVEGAEFLVLQGMRALIDRDRPHMLVEVTDDYLRGLGSGKQQLVDFMEGRGYKAFRVGRSVVPYTHADELQCDVLFVPPESPTLAFDERRVNFADFVAR